MCLSPELRLLNWSSEHVFCITPRIRSYLAVPAQRQVFGIVDDLIVLVFTLALTGLLFVILFALLACPSLLPLDVLVGQLPLLLRGPSRDLH